MEEDIKVLEEYLNYEVTKRKLSGCEILAIENLIARNKELEEIIDNIKKFETDIYRSYDYDMGVSESFIKFLEEKGILERN